VGRYRIPWGGDILTKLNGEPLGNLEDLARIIDSRQPGETLIITFIRDGKTYRTKVKLTKRPRPSLIRR
jgi:S1-C subfamily serine protease